MDRALKAAEKRAAKRKAKERAFARSISSNITARPARRGPARAKAPFRRTFDSASSAAERFYSENIDFVLPVVEHGEPREAVREWLRSNHGKTGRMRVKDSSQTPWAKKIIDSANPVRAALTNIFSHADGRRWDRVDWDSVRALGESLLEFATTTAPLGAQGWYWFPVATEDDDAKILDRLSVEGDQDAYRRFAESLSAQEVDRIAATYEAEIKRLSRCMSSDRKRRVTARLEEIRSWKDHGIPENVCGQGVYAGHTCDLEPIHTELKRLRDACESDAAFVAWLNESVKRSPRAGSVAEGLDETPVDIVPVGAYEGDAPAEPAPEDCCTPTRAAKVMGRLAVQKRRENASKRRKVREANAAQRTAERTRVSAERKAQREARGRKSARSRKGASRGSSGAKKSGGTALAGLRWEFSRSRDAWRLLNANGYQVAAMNKSLGDWLAYVHPPGVEAPRVRIDDDATAEEAKAKVEEAVVSAAAGSWWTGLAGDHARGGKTPARGSLPASKLSYQERLAIGGDARDKAIFEQFGKGRVGKLVVDYIDGSISNEENRELEALGLAKGDALTDDGWVLYQTIKGDGNPKAAPSSTVSGEWTFYSGWAPEQYRKHFLATTVRAPGEGDPERSAKMKRWGVSPHLAIKKEPTAKLAKAILEDLPSIEPATLHGISMRTFGLASSTTSDTKVAEALWDLVEAGEVEHTLSKLLGTDSERKAAKHDFVLFRTRGSTKVPPAGAFDRASSAQTKPKADEPEAALGKDSIPVLDVFDAGVMRKVKPKHVAKVIKLLVEKEKLLPPGHSLSARTPREGVVYLSVRAKRLDEDAVTEGMRRLFPDYKESRLGQQELWLVPTSLSDRISTVSAKYADTLRVLAMREAGVKTDAPTVLDEATPAVSDDPVRMAQPKKCGSEWCAEVVGEIDPGAPIRVVTRRGKQWDAVVTEIVKVSSRTARGLRSGGVVSLVRSKKLPPQLLRGRAVAPEEPASTESASKPARSSSKTWTPAEVVAAFPTKESARTTLKHAMTRRLNEAVPPFFTTVLSRPPEPMGFEPAGNRTYHPSRFRIRLAESDRALLSEQFPEISSDNHAVVDLANADTMPAWMVPIVDAAVETGRGHALGSGRTLQVVAVPLGRGRALAVAGPTVPRVGETAELGTRSELAKREWLKSVDSAVAKAEVARVGEVLRLGPDQEAFTVVEVRQAKPKPTPGGARQGSLVTAEQEGFALVHPKGTAAVHGRSAGTGGTQSTLPGVSRKVSAEKLTEMKERSRARRPTTVIVTRHPALARLIREKGLATARTPVLTHVSEADIRGKHVVGVLPGHLVAHAASYTEVPLAMTERDREAAQRGDLPIARLREIAGDPVAVRSSSPPVDINSWSLGSMSEDDVSNAFAGKWPGFASTLWLGNNIASALPAKLVANGIHLKLGWEDRGPRGSTQVFLVARKGKDMTYRGEASKVEVELAFAYYSIKTSGVPSEVEDGLRSAVDHVMGSEKLSMVPQSGWRSGSRTWRYA